MFVKVGRIFLLGGNDFISFPYWIQFTFHMRSISALSVLSRSSSSFFNFRKLSILGNETGLFSPKTQYNSGQRNDFFLDNIQKKFHISYFSSMCCNINCKRRNHKQHHEDQVENLQWPIFQKKSCTWASWERLNYSQNIRVIEVVVRKAKPS